jgi:L,D-peptidoglycan transpeptidase YkuD (ErfK/YbiS/YcfS/YnhG family)
VKKKDQNTKKKLQNIMDYNKSTSRCGGIVFFHIPLGVFAFVEASHLKKK